MISRFSDSVNHARAMTLARTYLRVLSTIQHKLEWENWNRKDH